MEMLAGLVELLFIVNIAWLVVGLPVWFVLAVVTFVGNRRSIALNQAGDVSAPEGSPAASKSGRPARIIALAVLGLTVFIVAMFAVTSTWGDEGSGMTVVFWSACVLVISWDVLSAVLSVLLVAVMRDIFTDKRVAGRDTVAAYVVIALSHGGVLGLVFALGLLRNLVP